MSRLKSYDNAALFLNSGRLVLLDFVCIVFILLIPYPLPRANKLSGSRLLIFFAFQDGRLESDIPSTSSGGGTEFASSRGINEVSEANTAENSDLQVNTNSKLSYTACLSR